MASPSHRTLPDGYRAPLAFVDNEHHGAWIHICNAFGLLILLITLAIRVYIRMKISPPFKYDDMTLAVATALAIIQSGITFGEVHQGIGTSIRLLNGWQLGQAQRLAYAADIFYILAIYVGKCSIVLLYLRLVADRMQRTIAWSMLASCCTLGLVSLLLMALRCNLSHPWAVDEHTCTSFVAQASAIAALDLVTELGVFSISIILVWGLCTKASNKYRVVLAFAIRLPVVAVMILRLVYLKRSLSSSDPTLTGAIASILTQIEIFYGTMAATVPCLRPFLAGFVTNYGAMGRDTIMAGSQIGPGSRKDRNKSKSGSSLVMTSLASSRNRASAFREKFRRSGSEMLSNVSDTLTTRDEPYCPVVGQNETTVTRGNIPPRGEYEGSIQSNDSTRVIIKKEVQLTVGSEQEQPRRL